MSETIVEIRVPAPLLQLGIDRIAFVDYSEDELADEFAAVAIMPVQTDE